MLLNYAPETKKSLNIRLSKTTCKPLGMVRMLPIIKLGLAFRIVELWSLSLQKENDRVTEGQEAPPGIAVLEAPIQ